MSRMLILQNQNFHDRLLNLDLQSGKLREYSRKKMGDTSSIKINGCYSVLSDSFIAIYVLNREVFVRIGDQSIQLDGQSCVEVDGPDACRLLTIKRKGEVIAQVQYRALWEDKIEGDLTACVEDEDFDIGLFIKNVWSCPERRQLVMEQWNSEDSEDGT